MKGSRKKKAQKLSKRERKEESKGKDELKDTTGKRSSIKKPRKLKQ